MVPFSINQKYVAGLCKAGDDVDFVGYPGGTHMSILDAGSPLSTRLEEWTEERFAAAPATGNCPG